MTKSKECRRKKKKSVPFSFQESQTPFSSLRALDSLSTYLTISSLISNEYSGLISFRTDWFNLLAVQRTLKRLLQHHNSKAFILQCSPFFMSNSNIRTWLLEKTVLTILTFVGKMKSLLFNMLSRFVIAFLPRSKHLLIFCLQPPSGVILDPKKINSATLFIFPHLFAMKWWDQMPWP